MILSHAWQAVARKVARSGPEYWDEPADRVAVELALATGEARRRWVTAEQDGALYWRLDVRLARGRAASGEAAPAGWEVPAAPLPPPEAVAAPAPPAGQPYGPTVPRVRRAPAHPIGGATYAPYAFDVARW